MLLVFCRRLTPSHQKKFFCFFCSGLSLHPPAVCRASTPSARPLHRPSAWSCGGCDAESDDESCGARSASPPQGRTRGLRQRRVAGKTAGGLQGHWRTPGHEGSTTAQCPWPRPRPQPLENWRRSWPAAQCHSSDSQRPSSSTSEQRASDALPAGPP